MERRRKFNKPMAESSGVAHAATREDGPDVWIFDFRCEKKNPDRVHFSTDRGNQKFRAFTANDRVAFAALPFRGTARTRSTDAMRLPGFKEALTFLDFERTGHVSL